MKQVRTFFLPLMIFLFVAAMLKINGNIEIWNADFRSLLDWKVLLPLLVPVVLVVLMRLGRK